jgi:uncharacterized membrane protein
MMLVWIELIALVVWGVGRRLNAGASTPEETPLEIRRRRYARGGINQEEFEQAKEAVV